jgi:Protein of unknown function (DUF2934)
LKELIMAMKKPAATTKRQSTRNSQKEQAPLDGEPTSLAITRQITLVSTDDIRLRAYYLSLERNGGEPNPVADWLRAERELTNRAGRSTAQPRGAAASRTSAQSARARRAPRRLV